MAGEIIGVEEWLVLEKVFAKVLINAGYGRCWVGKGEMKGGSKAVHYMKISELAICTKQPEINR